MSSEVNYQVELAFARRLAKEAIEIALSFYKKSPKTDVKADSSPVTEADKTINRLVIDEVKANFVGHGVLGEEESFAQDRETLWVCDPIDGTIAFAMGEPTFCFSLAIVVEGVPVVAVAADIASGRIFHAVKGQGAFIDGEPTTVSERSLDESWLAFPSNLDNLLKSSELYEKLSNAACQTNVMHGGVFKGLLIAEGLSDGTVWNHEISPWDMAAVKLIVEEAGGKMTDKVGNEQLFNNTLNGVIVSNGRIHDELVELATASKVK